MMDDSLDSARKGPNHVVVTTVSSMNPIAEEIPISNSKLVNNGAITTTRNVPETSNINGPAGDGSLEAKNAKLREYIFQLRKSVQDKSQEIERLKTENSKNSGKSHNLSSLQQEYDKALDEVEKYKLLDSSLQKDLQASIEEKIRLKETNIEYHSQLKVLTELSDILKGKLETSQGNEDELKRLRIRLIELETELKELKDTQVDVKQEKRHQAILSLEITNYEKKLDDANEKLQEQEKEREVQRQLLENKDKEINSLTAYLANAEIMIEELGQSQKKLQNEVEQKSEKVTFLQGELSKGNEKLNEKKSELLKLSREFETAKLNFSTDSNALIERSDKLSHLVFQQEHKISALEEHKRSRESHISNLKLEMIQLEAEFNNYKLKAQTMLNTQKPGGIQSGETSDELENLQKIVQEFHSEISVLKSDMRTLKLENETLSLERAELGLKLTQQKTVAMEREVFLDLEIQRFKDQIKHKEYEFHGTLEAAKIETSALVASYTVQLDSLKRGYESKIKTLEEQILTLNGLLETIQTTSQRRDFDAVQTRNESILQSVPPTHPLLIDTSAGIALEQLRMIPRGECEGSENNTSPQNFLQPSAHCDISFEQLLSTNMDNISREKYIENESQLSSSQNFLKEELTRCRNQIKHLQNILRESESNCERLTQLSEALKHEIRRVERDSERKVHLKENTEYLKNIIIKFVSLTGEDEKLRLIPVFKTMLRLSPSETENLEAAVRGGVGGDHSMREGQEQSSSLSWKSYVPLPNWSFGGSGK